MNTLRKAPLLILAAGLTIAAASCTNQPANNSNSVAVIQPSPSPSPSPTTSTEKTAITLPVLNALFSDETFKAKLKSKINLTDDQVNTLQQSANEEIARLRQANAEQAIGDAAEARERALQTIRNTIGDDKANALLALANEQWLKGSEEAGTSEPPLEMLPGPNAVPKDSRIVVNIPAFRMDLFQDGSLVKSYKIGIGYPQFPLPTGLRKATQIIFNPTWTPPDEPWVASMKDVVVGERIEAGSKLNPLGPIKIPIGLPSLIHGGKPPAKIGTFASHGCVGLTNTQVKDFAKRLAQTGDTQISDKTINTYLSDNSKTKVVKLKKIVPVELRYETIVVEDGRLHIYKDVYDQDANTEENLRAVLAANAINFEDLSAEERAQITEALNAMSAHPKKLPRPSPVGNTNSPIANSNQAKTTDKKSAKKSPRNLKEMVIEIAALAGKGYPEPVDLDQGTGRSDTRVAATSGGR